MTTPASSRRRDVQSRAARFAVGEDGQAELGQLLLRLGFTVVATGQENWLPAAAHDVLALVRLFDSAADWLHAHERHTLTPPSEKA